MWALSGLLCACVGSSPRAQLEVVRMNASNNNAATDNILPFFRFINTANEGGIGIGVNIPSQYSARDGFSALNDALPDYLLREESVIADTTDRTLPYRIKDGWTAERVATDVPMVVLENDVLRVEIAPLYGGKIHSAVDKRSGKPLVFEAREHQCVNDGVLRCSALGGSQWNWSPGEVGHATSNENAVYVARIATSRGDAVRIWEFDRWNATVWQVDVWIDDDATLWTHVSLINPTDAPLRG